MKKPPFSLYGYNGLIYRTNDLKYFFKNEILSLYDIPKVSRDIKPFFSSINDEPFIKIFKTYYYYIILDDNNNPVTQEELKISLDDFKQECKEKYPYLFNVPNVSRGIPIPHTGIKRIKSWNKRTRSKSLYCLNEIKQTSAQYKDEYEPSVRSKRRFHDRVLWEDDYIFNYTNNRNWKKYRKYQYK